MAEGSSAGAAGASAPGPTVAAPVGLVVDAAVPGRGARLRLDVAPGEVVAVVGPNGAGKSTLVGIVAGLVPHDGAVRVDGRDVTRTPPHRRGVGLVAQDGLLLPHLDALANVALGPRAHGAGRTAARARARAELVALDAAHLARRAPATLSGGQAQRVALARALACSPRLLLLDEPFAALDVTSAAVVRDRLAAVLAARPTTTVLVTHSAADVRALATRVVVVEDGRVVQDGPVDDVLAHPATAFVAGLAAR